MVGLETLRKGLDERDSPKAPTKDIVQMADFLPKNKFFEFNGEVKRQKFGTAIGTKFAPPYACIFMDEVETEFLKSQELQLFLWLRYIDGIFLYGIMEKRSSLSFLMNLVTFIPISNLHMKLPAVLLIS